MIKYCGHLQGEYCKMSLGTESFQQKISGSKLQIGIGLMGSLSCLQVFNKGLSPEEVKYHQDCHSSHQYQEDPCHPNEPHYEGYCYSIHTEPVTYQEAEDLCSTSQTSPYLTNMVWSKFKFPFHFLSVEVERRNLTGAFWVGVEKREDPARWTDA